MEARALFEQFENNIKTIHYIINEGIEIGTTPFKLTLPLELDLLCELITEQGLAMKLIEDDLLKVKEFIEAYSKNKERIDEIFLKTLEDKKTIIKTSEGRLLAKEFLIQRLTFISQAAHQLEVIKSQKELGSPKQYNYPYLLTNKK